MVLAAKIGNGLHMRQETPRESCIRRHAPYGVGKEWDYNFLTSNCKHYICKGLEAGGANLPPHVSSPENRTV